MDEFNKQNPLGAVEYKDNSSGPEHPELEFAGDWKMVLEKCHCISDLSLYSSGQLVVATGRNTVLGWMDFGLSRYNHSHVTEVL